MREEGEGGVPGGEGGAPLTIQYDRSRESRNPKAGQRPVLQRVESSSTG